MTLGFLGDLLGLNNGDPTIQAAQDNKTATTNFGTTANNLIDTGATQAGGDLSALQSQYAPLAAGADAKGALYSDALGLNGAAGNATATSAYQAAPGYQYNLDQGLQALDRGAAAHGMSDSGNWNADTLNYAEGQANQGYNQWLSNLGSSNDILGTGLTGAGTADTDLANLATGTATAKTGIATDVLNGTLGANNQQAAGQTTNMQGLSSLFGNVVGGLGSLAGYGGF